MKFKKMMSLVLASVMAVSMLAACGNTKEKEESKVDQTVEKTEESSVEESSSEEVVEEEPEFPEITLPLEETYEFSMFTRGPAGQTKPETYAWVWLTEEYANIKADVETVEDVELNEKLNLHLNTGEYADCIFGTEMSMNMVNKYGESGIFIPLEDLIKEYAPNMCAWLDEVNGWNEITSPDGHIYCLPGTREMYVGHGTFWVNQRWMDNVGLDMPTGWDELYELLKAFKEQDANGNGDPNDETPLVVAAAELQSLYAFDNTFVLNTSANLVGPLSDGSGFGKVQTHENTKAFFEFCRKLYAEGLVNEDCFIATQSDNKGKYGVNDTAGMIAGMYIGFNGNSDLTPEYVTVKPWDVGMASGGQLVPGDMMITDKCERPEVLIKWIDYMYTQEGARLRFFGIKDLNYYVDEEGARVKMSNEDPFYNNYKPYGGNMFGPGCDMDNEGYLMRASKTKNYEEYVNVYENLLLAERTSRPISVVLTEAETNEAADISAAMGGYTSEYFANVVVGKVSLEETWDDYVKELDNMGYDRLVEIYNNAYARVK